MQLQARGIESAFQTAHFPPLRCNQAFRENSLDLASDYTSTFIVQFQWSNISDQSTREVSLSCPQSCLEDTSRGTSAALPDVLVTGQPETAVITLMVSKLLLSAVLLALAQGISCPAFACDYTLGTDKCATLANSGVFHLNGNGCESDFYCLAASMEYWALTLNATSSTTYYCQRRDIFPVYVRTESTFSYESCPSKAEGRTFKAGTGVVFCESNNDCLLQDDTITECVCTIRSDQQGVCMPDLSNENLFSGYWAACGDLGRIEDLVTYNYWMAFIASWLWVQSDLTCLQTFLEVESLQQTTTIFNSASLLPVGLLALLH